MPQDYSDPDREHDDHALPDLEIFQLTALQMPWFIAEYIMDTCSDEIDGMAQTNLDHSNGIRYGVISMHDVAQAWADCSEADYGKPTCPQCGKEASCTVLDGGASSGNIDDYEQYTNHGCADHYCTHCKITFDSEYAFGGEPIGWNYSGDGYALVDCLDSDIMVLKSPFYTYAEYCSPCVPGAGNLNQAGDKQSGGAQSYCLGHDWFEDGKAPYPVYCIGTNDEIVAA